MAAKVFVTPQIANRIFKLPYRIPIIGCTIDLVKPQNFHEVAAFSSKIFSQEEPLFSYIKLTQPELYQLGMEMLKHPDNDSLSLDIRNQSSELVATAISQRVILGMYQKKEFNPRNFTPSVYKLMKLTQESRIFYDKYYQVNNLSGGVMDFCMAAVSKKSRGKQLATYLLFGSAVAGLSKGYKRAICEPTNIFSMRGVAESGFKVLSSVDYSSFKIGGDIVFEGVDKEFTKLVNQQNPTRHYAHTAQRLDLTEAPLEDVLKAVAKCLNI